MAEAPKVGPDFLVDIPSVEISACRVIRPYTGKVCRKERSAIIDISKPLCGFEVVFAMVEPVVGICQEEFVVGLQLFVPPVSPFVI